jgi:hypothetical protein
MKSTIYFVLTICFIAFLGSCTQKKQEINTLSDKEKKDGWILLFDGKTTEGWRGYNKPAFPEKGWRVKDSTLECLSSDMGEAGSGGDIITIKKYSNFELKLEWKIAKAGNSGILFLASEIPNEPIWHGAPEMQILDAKNFPIQLNPGQLPGSLYDLVPANPQTVKPYGQWNSVKIKLKDGALEQWQNDTLVVKCKLWTAEFDTLVKHSKFSEYPLFKNLPHEGFIGLQDHGGGAWFRNIKIKEL